MGPTGPNEFPRMGPGYEIIWFDEVEDFDEVDKVVEVDIDEVDKVDEDDVVEVKKIKEVGEGIRFDEADDIDKVKNIDVVDHHH